MVSLPFLTFVWSAQVENPQPRTGAGGSGRTQTASRRFRRSRSVDAKSVWVALAGFAASTVLVAVAPAAQAAASPAAPPPVADVTQRPDDVSASVAARRLGHAVEVADRRDARSSTFVNADGTQRLVTSSEVVNVPGAEGELVPADTGVRPLPDHSWAAGPTLLSPRFAAAAGPAAVEVTTGSGKVSFGLSNGLAGSSKADGVDGIRFASVLPGVDLTYQVQATALKETLVLAGPGGGSSWKFDYAAPGMRAVTRPGGAIAFVDAKTGVKQGVLPVGKAVDSAGLPASTPVAYALTTTGGKIQIDVHGGGCARCARETAALPVMCTGAPASTSATRACSVSTSCRPRSTAR